MESRYNLIRGESEYAYFLKFFDIESLYHSIKESEGKKLSSFQLNILDKDEIVFHKPVVNMSFRTADLLGKFLSDYKLKIRNLSLNLNYENATSELIDLVFHIKTLIKINRFECEAAAKLFQKFYYFLDASGICESENVKNLLLDLHMIFYKAYKNNLRVVGTYQVCAHQYPQKWTLL